MSRVLPLTAAGLLLFPAIANAEVIAASSLDSGPITVTFSHDATEFSGELFSTASATEGPIGTATSDNNPLPGVANTATAIDGGMRADSRFAVDPPNNSFMSDASGLLTTAGMFGNAIGEVTGSFEFFNPEDGLTITIMTNLTRTFDLDTEFVGDLASGATSLSLALLNDVGFFLPTISFSNPNCDPNAAFSVGGGKAFSDSCTTSATYTFAGLPAGGYDLTFASNSSVDVVSEVPLPAAFGLFGLGLAGLGLKNRLRGRKTA